MTQTQRSHVVHKPPLLLHYRQLPWQAQLQECPLCVAQAAYDNFLGGMLLKHFAAAVPLLVQGSVYLPEGHDNLISAHIVAGFAGICAYEKHKACVAASEEDMAPLASLVKQSLHSLAGGPARIPHLLHGEKLLGSLTTPGAPLPIS